MKLNVKITLSVFKFLFHVGVFLDCYQLFATVVFWLVNISSDFRNEGILLFTFLQGMLYLDPREVHGKLGHSMWLL